MFHDILERKKRILKATKRKSPKSRNFGIFKKGLIQGFDKKNGNFFYLHSFSKIGKENVFHDILEWKDAFPDHRNKKLTVEKLNFFIPMVLVKSNNFYIFLF